MEFYAWIVVVESQLLASKASTREELARGRLWAHFSTRFFSLSRSPIATYEAARWKQLKQQRLLSSFCRRKAKLLTNPDTSTYSKKGYQESYIPNVYNKVLHSVWELLQNQQCNFSIFGAKIQIFEFSNCSPGGIFLRVLRGALIRAWP